jgi:transcriptional regulator with XRE-family HTH domain
MASAKTKKISSVTPLPELSIAERLKVVRSSRGLTQQEMAELLGISRPSVTQLEGGRHQPSSEVLETIVEKLEVSRNWLWFGNGSMDEYTRMSSNTKALGDLDERPYIDVKFVTCKVRGGFMDMMDDGSGYDSLDNVRVYDPSPDMFRPGTLGFEIDGDSMEPQLRSGMRVVGVQVALEDIKYATSGVYVVAFANQLTIKRIKDNEILERRSLVLHADNPQAGSLRVAAEDIRAMWKVNRIIYGEVI